MVDRVEAGGERGEKLSPHHAGSEAERSPGRNSAESSRPQLDLQPSRGIKLERGILWSYCSVKECGVFLGVELCTPKFDGMISHDLCASCFKKAVIA